MVIKEANSNKTLYLYHATNENNLKSILKNGLSINPPTHNWDDMYCDGMVFLAFDADVAEDYVYESDNPPESVAILKVKLDSLNPKYFGYDWNNRCEYIEDINSCVYMKDIAPNLLKVCNSNNEPSQTVNDFYGTDLFEIVVETFTTECETNLENYEGGDSIW